jgi:hypothetical protein
METLSTFVGTFAGDCLLALATACVVVWVIVTAASERRPRANRRNVHRDVDATF